MARVALIFFALSLALPASGETPCTEHDFALTPYDVEPLRAALAQYPELSLDGGLRESRSTLTCDRRVRFRAELAPYAQGESYRREFSVECLRPLDEYRWECATPAHHTRLVVDNDEVEFLGGDLAEAISVVRFAREALVSARGIRKPWNDERVTSKSDFVSVLFVPGAGWEVATDEVVMTFRRRLDGELDVVETRRAEGA